MAKRPTEDPDRTTGGRPSDLTWEKFQLVCEVLAETGSKYKACEALAFTYSAVATAIKDAAGRGDDEWQELWDASYDQFRDSLEQEARRRARDGVLSPVFGKDGKVGEKLEYDSRLMELLLKGHFPERYRDKIFVSGNVGLEPIDAFSNLSPKAKREIRAIVMRDLEEQRELSAARGASQVIEGAVTTAVALEDMRNQAEDEE